MCIRYSIRKPQIAPHRHEQRAQRAYSVAKESAPDEERGNTARLQAAAAHRRPSSNAFSLESVCVAVYSNVSFRFEYIIHTRGGDFWGLKTFREKQIM